MFNLLLNRKVVGIAFLCLSFLFFIGIFFFKEKKALETASLISLLIGVMTIPNKESSEGSLKKLIPFAIIILIIICLIYVITKK
jgi:hypothetical protein